MPEPKLPKVFKEYDPKDSNPCSGCSHCCEYISLEIDKPTELKDFDNILWYILHKDVWVYIDEEKDWYIQFNTPCEKLVDKRCGFYPTRPQICRDYEPEACVRYSRDYEESYMFKNEEDLYRYLAKKRPAIYEKMKNKIGIAIEKKEPLKMK